MLGSSGICLPQNPLPDNQELGCHPLVKVMSVEGAVTKYHCLSCGQWFSTTRGNNDPEDVDL